MRSTTLTWLLLLTFGLGSASINWVRIDGLGNGWMGVQLASGEEVRVEFIDLDGSGDLNASDLRGAPRQQLGTSQSVQPQPRRSLYRRAGQQVLSDARLPLQELGN